jgi:hypothetical protein
MIDIEIKKLRPYFYSLREIKGNASLDLLIPNKWKYQITSLENIKVIQQDDDGNKKLISIITKLNSENTAYSLTLACANEIIKFNIEEEEKEKLFQEKMKELESIFKNSDLEKLKQIKFTENEEQNRMVDVGDRKGQEGDRGVEEKTD